jgi:hypothetical protein
VSHQTISFIKSGIRLLGYALIASPHPLYWAAIVLIVSELVGILEEVGHD